MNYANVFPFIDMSRGFTDASRGIITVVGQDAGQFLQGVITNDIQNAKADAWLYALVLTAQGKIMADVFIQSVANGYLLDCPRTEIPALLAKLKLYRLRAKIEIEEFPGWHILVSDDKGQDDPRHPDLWKRSLTEEEIVGDQEVYHAIRMKLLVPDFAMDLWAEKFFPHELAMNNLHAIDYKKGCYVGQEVTARVEYRGVVRKKLHLVHHLKATSKGEAVLGGPEAREVGMMLGSSAGLGLALLREDGLDNLHTAGGAELIERE